MFLGIAMPLVASCCRCCCRCCYWWPPNPTTVWLPFPQRLASLLLLWWWWYACLGVSRKTRKTNTTTTSTTMTSTTTPTSKRRRREGGGGVGLGVVPGASFLDAHPTMTIPVRLTCVFFDQCFCSEIHDRLGISYICTFPTSAKRARILFSVLPTYYMYFTWCTVQTDGEARHEIPARKREVQSHYSCFFRNQSKSIDCHLDVII